MPEPSAACLGSYPTRKPAPPSPPDRGRWLAPTGNECGRHRRSPDDETEPPTRVCLKCHVRRVRRGVIVKDRKQPSSRPVGVPRAALPTRSTYMPGTPSGPPGRVIRHSATSYAKTHSFRYIFAYLLYCWRAHREIHRQTDTQGCDCRGVTFSADHLAGLSRCVGCIM